MSIAMLDESDSVEEADCFDHPRRRAVVRALHDQLRPPAGWRVEIIGGELVVSSVPTPAHAYTVEIIRTALGSSLPPTHGAYENVELEEPVVDRYVPDIGVWPREVLRQIGSRPHPAQCALAVDVMSSDPRTRDSTKAAGYARCGIPVYLVVDRRSFRCVILAEPEGGQYTKRREIPFGKPVTLPLETPVTIETSEF